jgi:hypothetical protein
LEVYDLDTAGLDAAWRVSLGFTSKAASQGDQGAEPTRTPVPTLALRVTVVRPSSPTPTPTVTIPAPSPTAIPSPSPSPTSASSPSPIPFGITSTVEAAPVQNRLSSAPVIVSGAVVLAALVFLGLRFAIKKRRSGLKGTHPLGPVSD